MMNKATVKYNINSNELKLNCMKSVSVMNKDQATQYQGETKSSQVQHNISNNIKQCNYMRSKDG